MYTALEIGDPVLVEWEHMTELRGTVFELPTVPGEPLVLSVPKGMDPKDRRIVYIMHYAKLTRMGDKDIPTVDV